MSTFDQKRAEAQRTRKVPSDFADWPRKERDELWRLAHLTTEASEAQAEQLIRQKPATADQLRRSVDRERHFERAIAAAMCETCEGEDPEWNGQDPCPDCNRSS